MTSKRVLILLVAAIVIVAGATWLASRSDNGGSAMAGTTVFPDLQAALNDISEVRLAKADGARTTLRKGDDGWVVAEREFPADISRVRRLLIDLTELKVVEEKTRNPDNYEQLGVADVDTPGASGTLVEAVTPQKTFALIVGKSSGTRSTYVRPADSELSLLVSPQLMPDADPRRWIDRTVVDLPQERIQTVEIDPTSGPAYRVTRENKEQENFTVPGLPKGRELSSPGAANPLASGLASFSLDDVRRTDAGDDSKDASDGPSATFHTFDGLEIELRGHEDGDRRLVSLAARATSDEAQDEARRLNERFGGWLLEIPGYKYDGLFRPREELLASKD